MGAPANNKFWELRHKHGADRLFETADDLWKEACDYFEWCVATPLIAIEYYGKDAMRCEVPKMRAFTIKGFCVFACIDEDTFLNYGNKETNKDLFGIVTRIRNVIYTQKFEGAAAGLLNSNIISRELGLVDKKEVDASIGAKELIIKGEKFADKD